MRGDLKWLPDPQREMENLFISYSNAIKRKPTDCPTIKKIGSELSKKKTKGKTCSQKARQFKKQDSTEAPEVNRLDKSDPDYSHIPLTAQNSRLTMSVVSVETLGLFIRVAD